MENYYVFNLEAMNMKKFDFYVCEGQISIFDYLQQSEERKITESVIETEETATKAEKNVTKTEESVIKPIAAASEPKKCCGVIPWLKKNRCVQWDACKPRYYKMAYICPKCGKVAVDNIGWPIEGYGIYEDAARQALTVWNNPDTVFEIKDYNNPKTNYVHVLYGEEDDWFNLYGQKYEDYKRPIVERANEEYRKKKAYHDTTKDIC